MYGKDKGVRSQAAVTAARGAYPTESGASKPLFSVNVTKRTGCILLIVGVLVVIAYHDKATSLVLSTFFNDTAPFKDLPADFFERTAALCPALPTERHTFRLSVLPKPVEPLVSPHDRVVTHKAFDRFKRIFALPVHDTGDYADTHGPYRADADIRCDFDQALVEASTTLGPCVNNKTMKSHSSDLVYEIPELVSPNHLQYAVPPAGLCVILAVSMPIVPYEERTQHYFVLDDVVTVPLSYHDNQYLRALNIHWHYFGRLEAWLGKGASGVPFNNVLNDLFDDFKYPNESRG